MRLGVSSLLLHTVLIMTLSGRGTRGVIWVIYVLYVDAKNTQRQHRGSIDQLPKFNSISLNEVFGTDPDRNRALEKPPAAELFPCRRKPLRRTRLLRPGTNSGMKRTSVVEHNLYFARFAIMG